MADPSDESAPEAEPSAATAAPIDDAAEALRAQDEAQTFELPDRAGGSAPDLLPGMSFDAERQRQPSPQQPSRRSELHTLEDLWAAYPKIGRGDWKYRVERLHPKTYGGVQVAGVLGDFLERMSLEEFRKKFGGNLYEITVMQPVAEGGPDGAAGYRRVKTIRLRLPGSPTMSGVEEEHDMQGRYGQGYPPFAPAGEHHQVRTKELELQHERAKMEHDHTRELERELRDRMESTGRVPEGTIESLSRTQQIAFEEVKRNNESVTMMWQEQAEQLRADLKAKDSEMQQLRRDLAEAQVNAANTARHIETEAMRQQKERYDDELRRLRDDHGERTQRLQEDHRKEVGDITQRHTDERRNYESQQQLERERVRDDSKTRIEAAEVMARREVEGLRRDYDARIEDMRRQQERELQSVKERFESEIRAVRESEKSQASFARESADIKVSLSHDQAARYEAEAAQLRQEVEELRGRLHKPPMEALLEAKEMAGAFGMIEASDAKAEAEQQTMGQQLFGLAKGVVDNIPGIVERVTDARSRNQTIREQELRQIARLQQHQVGGHRRPMPGQHRLALPPGVQQAPRSVPGVGSIPPPAMGPMGPMGPMAGDVPLHSGAMDQISVPGSMPIQGFEQFNTPSPVQPMAPQAEAGVTTPGSAMGSDGGGMPLGAGPPPQPYGYVPPPMVPPPTPVPDQAIMQAQPPPQPPPAASVAEPPAPAQAHGPALLATLPSEALQEFFNSLEQAVQTRMVSPIEFAQQFIERVGREKTAELVTELQPSDVIDIVRQAGGASSALATRDGYRYVEELWMNAQMILSEPPPPAPPADAVMVTPPTEQMIPPEPPLGVGEVAAPANAPLPPEGVEPESGAG